MGGAGGALQLVERARAGEFERGAALAARALIGRSPLTGRNERVTLVTTQLGNGQFLYMAAVSPGNEYATYQRAFNDILRSLQLNAR